MRRNIYSVILLFLVSFFCFKEVVGPGFFCSNSVCFIQDFCEDDTTKGNEKTDPDSENKSDIFFYSPYRHNLIVSLFYCSFHKSYSAEIYAPPYSEIHLPPPELI